MTTGVTAELPQQVASITHIHRYQPAQLEVDLAAVASNLAWVRRRAAGRTLIAALKADAYGHGAVGIALKLEREGLKYLAVGSLEEAAAIRTAGVRTSIILLSAMVPEMADDVLDLGVIPTLDHRGAADALLSAPRRHKVRVVIKIDCGFGRFGVEPDVAVDFARAVAAMEGLSIEGVYTHIPFSDPAGLDWACKQTARFGRVVARLAETGIRPPLVQAIASPGLLSGIENPHSAIAVGHLLYGLNPLGPRLTRTAEATVLRPVLSAVRTKLIHAGPRPLAGDAAGYLRGGTGRVGVIPIGIHHSYRPAASEAFVIVDGRRAPVLRPCLENTVVDLSESPEAHVGSDVVVLGSSARLAISLDDLARWHLTTPLSVLAGLGRSLPKVNLNP